MLLQTICYINGSTKVTIPLIKNAIKTILTWQSTILCVAPPSEYPMQSNNPQQQRRRVSPEVLRQNQSYQNTNSAIAQNNQNLHYPENQPFQQNYNHSNTQTPPRSTTPNSKTSIAIVQYPDYYCVYTNGHYVQRSDQPKPDHYFQYSTHPDDVPDFAQQISLQNQKHQIHFQKTQQRPLDHPKKTSHRGIHITMGIVLAISVVAIVLLYTINPLGNKEKSTHGIQVTTSKTLQSRENLDQQNDIAESQNNDIQDKISEQETSDYINGTNYSLKNKSSKNVFYNGTQQEALVLTTTPPSANITRDGKIIGVTPFTWNNPDMYGEISVKLSKDGFSDKIVQIEYTGGNISKHFYLEKFYPKPAPPSQKIKPSASITKTTYAKPLQSKKQKPKLQKKKPPKSQNRDGLIFLSSIPPVADVYINKQSIGKTNIKDIKVPVGTYVVTFVKDNKSVKKTMTFVKGRNSSVLVRLK